MMTPEDGRRLEAIGLVRPNITPDFLREANLRGDTRELNKKWEINHDNNNLWIIATCGDSRILIPRPDMIISMRSIDLGGTKAKDIFLTGRAKLAVAMGHFGYFTPGKMTEGCGGGAAKKDSLNNHSHIKIARLQHYIDKNIDHPDVLVNAILNAKRIFEETGMPSIAVGQNHRTGKIYPVAIFTKEAYTVQSKFDLINLSKEYNEALIYAEEIPFLTEREIPPKSLELFKEFLDACQENMEALQRKFLNLEEMQKTQNPAAVWVSDKLPSIRARYDGLNIPNLIFKLHLTREKDYESGETKIDPEIQKDVIGQALYPISHAVENYRKLGEPFSDTKRFVVETSNIKNSVNFAQELAEQPEVQAWRHQDRDRRIIVIQNKVGISNITEYYEP